MVNWSIRKRKNAATASANATALLSRNHQVCQKTGLPFVIATAITPAPSLDKKIHDCLRAISRIDEQGGIFGSEMYRVSPLRVWLDSCEGLVDERLHPPRSRPGDKNNSLPRKSPSDAAFDGIQLIGTTLAGQRNLGGLYRRRWNALSGTTTT